MNDERNELLSLRMLDLLHHENAQYWFLEQWYVGYRSTVAVTTSARCDRKVILPNTTARDKQMLWPRGN